MGRKADSTFLGRAGGEEVGQQVALVAVGRHEMVVGFAGMADLPHFGQILAQAFVVSLRDDPWFERNGRAILEIDKTQRTVEAEFDLLAIEEMENRDIVFVEPQVLEGVVQAFRFEEQIGKDDHERALADFLRDRVQGSDEPGAALRGSGSQRLVNRLQVRGLTHRRDILRDLLAALVAGAVFGLFLAWQSVWLPAQFGNAGMAASIIILLVSIYLQILNLVPMVINRAAMLFLTVLAAPALLDKLDAVETLKAIVLGAIFIGAVVKLALWASAKFSKA